ncbi:hypothetical protein FRB95_014097 [Tulasnella sp. JGI-2019a]|nr:hypothetical protein FRB95_014097 [Tulasnella sp. JGI-2019a]
MGKSNGQATQPLELAYRGLWKIIMPTPDGHHIVLSQHSSSVLAHDIRDIQLTLKTWLYAAQTIGYTRESIYSHRDLNSDNVLLSVDGHSALTDVRYTKGYQRSSAMGTTPCDIRMGTRSFVAIDIALRYYQAYDGPIERPVVHNPLHDLESCWWGIAWQVFLHPTPADARKYYDPFALRTRFECLFMDEANRSHMWTERFPRILGSFPLSLGPALVSMNKIRADLLGWYHEAHRHFEKGVGEGADEGIFNASYPLFIATVDQMVSGYPAS